MCNFVLSLERVGLLNDVVYLLNNRIYCYYHAIVCFNDHHFYIISHVTQSHCYFMQWAPRDWTLCKINDLPACSVKVFHVAYVYMEIDSLARDHGQEE